MNSLPVSLRTDYLQRCSVLKKIKNKKQRLPCRNSNSVRLRLRANDQLGPGFTCTPEAMGAQPALLRRGKAAA